MKSFKQYPEETQATVNQAIHDYFEGIRIPAETAARLTAFVRDWQPETKCSERAIT